jgi:hypothetical protein
MNAGLTPPIHFALFSAMTKIREQFSIYKKPTQQTCLTAKEKCKNRTLIDIKTQNRKLKLVNYKNMNAKY